MMHKSAFFFIFQIRLCAQEGLEFLSERKEFWQQQKPVYARKNEALAKKRAIYHDKEPKTKATALVANAMMKFQSPVKKQAPSFLAAGDTAYAAMELSATTVVDRRSSIIKERKNSMGSNLSSNKKENELEAN